MLADFIGIHYMCTKKNCLWILTSTSAPDDCLLDFPINFSFFFLLISIFQNLFFSLFLEIIFCLFLLVRCIFKKIFTSNKNKRKIEMNCFFLPIVNNELALYISILDF